MGLKYIRANSIDFIVAFFSTISIKKNKVYSTVQNIPIFVLQLNLKPECCEDFPSSTYFILSNSKWKTDSSRVFKLCCFSYIYSCGM